MFFIFFFFLKQKTAYEITHSDWSSDVCFFFFKQKTAYEITHSDWSSDVCSSDLMIRRPPRSAQPIQVHPARRRRRDPAVEFSLRSEERRVGKECCALCRSRWS